MSPETCNRVRDALAAGNVWGDAALLAHAKDCAICESELAALKKRRDFRDAFPVLSSIADQSERAPSRPPVSADQAGRRASQRRHVLLMVAALVVMVGFLARRSSRSTPLEGNETAATAPPRFRISNIENALFESKVDGATVQSSMTRGVAAFQVERLTSRQRFLLALPDGEVEVRGTRFVVTVEGGKTQHVEVIDGTVAVRLHGRAEMLLTAGQRWPGAGSGRTVSFMHVGPPKDAAPPETSKPND